MASWNKRHRLKSCRYLIVANSYWHPTVFYSVYHPVNRRSDSIFLNLKSKTVWPNNILNGGYKGSKPEYISVPSPSSNPTYQLKGSIPEISFISRSAEYSEQVAGAPPLRKLQICHRLLKFAIVQCRAKLRERILPICPWIFPCPVSFLRWQSALILLLI